MLSIKDPPGVQRIPWPTSEDEDQSEDMRHQTSPMTWMLNEEEFPWLVDADGSHFSFHVVNLGRFTQEISDGFQILIFKG